MMLDEYMNKSINVFIGPGVKSFSSSIVSTPVNLQLFRFLLIIKPAIFLKNCEERRGVFFILQQLPVEFGHREELMLFYG